MPATAAPARTRLRHWRRSFQIPAANLGWQRGQLGAQIGRENRVKIKVDPRWVVDTHAFAGGKRWFSVIADFRNSGNLGQWNKERNRRQREHTQTFQVIIP